MGDFLSGPVVKNPLSNAGNTCSIPGQRAKILHVTGQQSLWATTTESTHLKLRANVPQTRLQTKLLMQTTEPTCSGAHVQLRPNSAKNKKRNIKNKSF